jgi:hypothetical protein
MAIDVRLRVAHESFTTADAHPQLQCIAIEAKCLQQPNALEPTGFAGIA